MAFDPRMARLQVDYERLVALENSNPAIRIFQKTGTPPEQYVLNLRCKSIREINQRREPVYAFEHHVSINLPSTYPRNPPEFQMLTKIWHPNIGFSETAPTNICIGDAGNHGYAPSMGLDDLVLRIVQMLRYQNYGIQRPLNVAAADWAAQQHNLFPLE
jgi:ubiquitin-protein ligase